MGQERRKSRKEPLMSAEELYIGAPALRQKEEAELLLAVFAGGRSLEVGKPTH